MKTFIEDLKEHCQKNVEVRVDSKKLLELVDAYEAAEQKLSRKIGVGNGSGGLFVYGDYEAIKAAQKIVTAKEEWHRKFMQADMRRERAESRLAEMEKQEPLYFWRMDDSEGWIECSKAWFDDTNFSNETRILYAKPKPSETIQGLPKEFVDEALAAIDEINNGEFSRYERRTEKTAEAVLLVSDEHILHLANKIIPTGFIAESNKNLLWFAKAVIDAVTPIAQPIIYDGQPIDARPKEIVNQQNSVDSNNENLIKKLSSVVSWIKKRETESSVISHTVETAISALINAQPVSTKHQRITEQDAYEIIEAAFEIKGNKNVLFMADFFENGGRTLLDKLNEHREQVTANKAEVPSEI